MFKQPVLQTSRNAFRNLSIVRQAPKRRLIAPPTRSSGPLLERRPDRELPPLPRSALWRWGTTLPIFIGLIAVSAAAIFNYQKQNSSVVNSTLYALRINPQARDLLGEEIYFRDRIPWIWGELNQLHGKIDIGFAVKGNKGSGFMKFRSFRKSRKGFVSDFGYFFLNMEQTC
jgi:cytochrome c oxidase assembly factor 1